MSVMDRLRDTQVSPKVAILSLAALLLIASLVIVSVRHAVSKSPELAAEVSPADPSALVEVEVRERNPAGPQDDVAADSDADGAKDTHAIIVERNLFKPLVTASSSQSEDASQSAGASADYLPPMLPAPDFGAGFGRGRSRGDADPQRTIAFTGIVETPEGTLALLENTATSESVFVAVGERAFGMEVVDVTSRSVVLESGYQTVRLAMGENKPDARPSAQPGTPPSAPGTPPAPPAGQTPPTPSPQVAGSETPAAENRTGDQGVDRERMREWLRSRRSR